MDVDRPAGSAGRIAEIGGITTPPRAARPDEARSFDAQLDEAGLQDGGASTRHFVHDDANTLARYGAPINQHITPVNGAYAHVLTSTGRAGQDLQFGDGVPRETLRDDLDPATARASFQPDSGTLTPRGGNLSKAGDDRVAAAWQEGALPNAIARAQRLPLEQVTQALHRHADAVAANAGPGTGAVTLQEDRLLTAEDKRSVLAWHMAGALPDEIAEAYRLPPEQVERVLQEHEEAAAATATSSRPATGTVTPNEGQHLTTEGENRAVASQTLGASSEAIAGTHHWPLQAVDRVLEQYERQEAEAEAGTAPVRRAATPERLQPGADEMGQLTLRAMWHEAKRDGPESAAGQDLRSRANTGWGHERHATRLGERWTFDQASARTSGREIGKVTGTRMKSLSRWLREQNLTGAPTRDRFTDAEREEVAMQYLFGAKSQSDLVHSGIAGKPLASGTIARHLARFNENYPPDSPARAAKEAEFRARPAALQEVPTPSGGEAGPSAPSLHERGADDLEMDG